MSAHPQGRLLEEQEEGKEMAGEMKKPCPCREEPRPPVAVAEERVSPLHSNQQLRWVG